MPPPSLVPFFDRDGRIRRWPARRSRQLEALAWVAAHFEFGRSYREAEVNAILDDLHAFRDATRIRRDLCDWSFLGRESDGSRYWLITSEAPPTAGRATPGNSSPG